MVWMGWGSLLQEAIGCGVGRGSMKQELTLSWGSAWQSEQ